MAQWDATQFLLGAVDILRDENGALTPLRMTPGQMALYKGDAGYHVRSLSCAGICMDCITDAETLTLRGICSPGSSHDVWAFDVEVDGALFAHREGSIASTPEIEWDVELPRGQKRLRLYFPCLAAVALRSLMLSGAQAASAPNEGTLLCLGDSITQGYTTRFPSAAYPHRLAKAMRLSLLNEAIAGETFNPDLLLSPPSCTPALITIAYGTNDWCCKTKEQAAQDAESFLHLVRKTWPRASLAVLGPLWRGDENAHPDRFPFSALQEILQQAADTYHACFIDGRTLMPQIAELTADGFLHPNDLGHLLLSNRLIEMLKKRLPART